MNHDRPAVPGSARAEDATDDRERATLDTVGGTDRPQRAESEEAEPEHAEPEVAAPEHIPASPARLALRRFRRQPAALVGLGLLTVMVVLAVFAPWIAPHDPLQQNLSRTLEGPSADHWLGTDDVGRDMLSRVIFGARISLGVSAAVVALAIAMALPLALIAGYLGGRIDSTVMRGMDALFAFPPLVLALSVRAMLGPELRNLVLALAIVFVPGFVRLIRGQVLSVRQETYIEASRSIGTPTRRTLVRHVLPNVAPPLIVQVALTLGFALLAEAALSFLGFGAPPPSATWGGMLKRAFDFVLSAPYQVFIPGGAITLTVLAYNLVGDGLRDALGRDVAPNSVLRRVLPVGVGTMPRPTERVADGVATPDEPLLAVDGLAVEFAGPTGWMPVVDGVSFSVDRHHTLGIVGESGCGKTVSSLAVMGLLPRNLARVGAGSVRLEGRELLDLSAGEWRTVRGNEIAMVFQEPTASLNPAFTVGNQIAEAVRLHRGLGRRAAWAHAVDMLDRVEIPSPGRRARSYPHELSGGMRQRAMIAMALACSPKVLIADEPTSALDVTVQAQILELLASLQEELGLGVIFVSHDLAVVAEVCDDVAVMYAGQIVERAAIDTVFEHPRHPYTEALLAARPRIGGTGRLATIPGRVPPPGSWPSGCRFAPRCAHAREECASPVPMERVDGTTVRCVRAPELSLRGTT